MPDSGNVIPISDEQAKAIQEGSKAIQEALKTLQGIGGFLKETFGTIPQDIVALLGGNWLKVRRAENLLRVAQKAKERLKARGVEVPEPASLSITLPIFVAAADESRDELQDIWARLLAAAADPSRARFFRLRFIEVAKQLDPLDAGVLSYVHTHGDRVAGTEVNAAAIELRVSRDQFEVSCLNLGKLGLLLGDVPNSNFLSALGREFISAVSD